MSAKESKLWYLDQVNVFKGMTSDEMQMMASMVTEKSSDKKEYIYFPEEPSKVLFFLKEGRVKIGTFSNDGKEIIKTILYPGSIFGELGLIGQEKRQDFAMAMDDNVVLCAMKTDDFQQVMKNNQSLNFEVTKHIGERLINMERKLEGLVFKDAQTRIIDFLKDMATKYGIAIGFETLIEHDLTHQEIAQLTATSRQTVTTVLNELKNDNKIHLRRKKILIRDLNNL